MAKLEDSPVSKRSPKSPSNMADSEKSKKYDRQIRLWGESGQSAIETSHVCLINGNCTGVETLKSLVLPGIGAFTIIDDHVVTGADVGNNFFLTESAIGQNRGLITSRLLNELNPDVRGDCIDDSLENLLESNTNHDIFSNYNLVIACDVMKEESLLQLSKILWDKQIPLLVLKSCGLFGYLRLQTREHVVVESHPDSVLEDLRLDNPFPELVKFFDSQDLDTMTRKHLSHTPSIIIIYKYLQKWQESSKKKLPSNFKEKDQLRTMIQEAAEYYRTKQDPNHQSDHEQAEFDRENFLEAVKGLNSCLTPSEHIPSEIKELLSQCQNESIKSRFWLMVRALKKFVDDKKCLPIRGTISDMTSDSNRYIALQKIYANKFKEDVTFFTQCLSSVLETTQSPLTMDKFHENDIKTFCKNARYLKVIRTSALVKEYPSKDCETTSSGQSSKSKMKELLAEEDLSCDRESSLNLYLMFRTLDRFKSRHSRDPGTDSTVDEDIVRMKTCFKDLLSEEFHINNASLGTREDLLQQMVAFGGSEVHAVSSILGGIAAHEAIKLITRQFVPIDQTLIFDGINCKTDYVSLF